MNAEEFVKLLDGVRQTSRGWNACCPSHDDNSPSLSVSTGDDGRILVHCFAGCTAEEITDVLGLHVRDLFPAQSTSPRVRRDAVRKRECERERRRQELHRKGCQIDLIREAEWLIQAAHGIKISRWSHERLDRELHRLANAYAIMHGELSYEY